MIVRPTTPILVFNGGVASFPKLLVFFVQLSMTHRISKTLIFHCPGLHTPPSKKWGRAELSQVSYNLETFSFLCCSLYDSEKYSDWNF